MLWMAGRYDLVEASAEGRERETNRRITALAALENLTHFLACLEWQHASPLRSVSMYNIVHDPGHRLLIIACYGQAPDGNSDTAVHPLGKQRGIKMRRPAILRFERQVGIPAQAGADGKPRRRPPGALCIKAEIIHAIVGQRRRGLRELRGPADHKVGQS